MKRTEILNQHRIEKKKSREKKDKLKEAIAAAKIILKEKK